MTIPGGYTGTYKAFSDAFTDSVRDASGGRLLIRTHGVGDLYPWNETWDAVNRGASEMALIQTGAPAGVDPAFDIADMITGNPMNLEQWIGYSSKMQPLTQTMLDQYFKKLLLLSYWYNPPEAFHSKKPLRSVKDIRGLKVRTYGPSVALFKKLGANPVVISHGEVYMALQLGTVDAGESGGYAFNYDIGYHEVAKYALEPAFHCPTYALHHIVNKDAFNALPPDLQHVVRVAAKAGGLGGLTIQSIDDNTKRKLMLQKGVEITTLSPEDYKFIYQKAKEVLNEARQKSAYAGKYVKLFEETMDLYGVKW